VKKIARNVAQTHLGNNQYITSTVEKVGLKMWPTFVIFKKIAKVNNQPMGENSANLVTLTVKDVAVRGRKPARST
jgi:hypothetical protein